MNISEQNSPTWRILKAFGEFVRVSVRSKNSFILSALGGENLHNHLIVGQVEKIDIQGLILAEIPFIG